MGDGWRSAGGIWDGESESRCVKQMELLGAIRFVLIDPTTRNFSRPARTYGTIQRIK